LKFIRWSVKPEVWDDHVIAASDLDFEFDVAFEGRNHSSHSVKPSAMPRNIRVQMPRHPSLLDRSFCMFFSFAMHVRQINLKYAVDRINLPFMCQACSSDNYHQHVGALDAINEQRLPKVSEGNICIRSLFIKISSAKNGNLICIPWCMHFISAFFQLVFR